MTNQPPQRLDEPRPLNEQERLEALESYRILDTEPERAYDDITAIAAQICGTPIALVSLVDSERQWFKSKIGLGRDETPRDVAFCDHTIRQREPLVVHDATLDPRFAGTPLVADAPHIRFYAGTPLVDPDGYGLGSLCVIDRKPRELSGEQIASLESLGRLVIEQLAQRRNNLLLAAALERVRLLDRLVPVCSYCDQIREDPGFWEEVRSYVINQCGADQTHGICPECLDHEMTKIGAA